MSTKNEKLEIFLSYLSEVYTKSASLYELISSIPRTEDEQLLLNINETFTLYHAAKVFYFSNDELEARPAEVFFTVFDKFYFELKQVFLKYKKETEVLDHKLQLMEDHFEKVSDHYQVF